MKIHSHSLLSLPLLINSIFPAHAEPLTCIGNGNTHEQRHPCSQSVDVDSSGEPCDTETHQCMTLLFPHEDGVRKQGFGCVRKDASDDTCESLRPHAGYLGLESMECSYCDSNDCNTCEKIEEEDLLSCQIDTKWYDPFFNQGLVLCEATTLSYEGLPCFKENTHCAYGSLDYEHLNVGTISWGCIAKIDNEDTSWTCDFLKDLMPKLSEPLSYQSCDYCTDDNCNMCHDNRDWMVFGMSRTTVAINAIASALSFFSSTLILYIIFKKTGECLQTIYHRLMVLLSTFDMMSSLFGGLSVFMLPKELTETEPLRDLYHGQFFGDWTSCRIQGFFIIFGGISSLVCTTFLSFYYVLVACKIDEWKLRRFFQSIAFIIPTVAGFGAAVYAKTNDFINPSAYEPFCGVNTWPAYFEGKQIFNFNLGIKIMSAGMILLLIINMIVIISIIFRNETDMHKQSEKISEISHQSQESEDSVDNSAKSKKKTQTRAVMKQALMYITAVLITFLPDMVSFINIYFDNPWVVNEYLGWTLTPLQGFWNMLIFVYHKTQIVRDADPSITSNSEALKKLLFASDVYEHMPIEGLENVEIADRIDEYNPNEYHSKNESKSSAMKPLDKESTSEMSGTSESNITDAKYSMYDGLSLESPSTASDAKLTTMHGNVHQSKKHTHYEKNEILQAGNDQESMAGMSFGDPSMTGMSFGPSMRGMSFGNDTNLYQLNTLDEDDELEA